MTVLEPGDFSELSTESMYSAIYSELCTRSESICTVTLEAEPNQVNWILASYDRMRMYVAR